ncbi:hypothetical protein NZD88_13645 [Chryseobacterium antibioticum]|uniref:Uncharacterized protein n=1 Tax=Chryseobacterium pyrolae TaxID=2987481 RepID=A0ABT2IIW6_9FLAO|nr:hypothetical protein [Chryseobacterium pyrolae]MCT2408589.1 hypothetical protein [Chryseobacterium pyrolae]
MHFLWKSAKPPNFYFFFSLWLKALAATDFVALEYFGLLRILEAVEAIDLLVAFFAIIHCFSGIPYITDKDISVKLGVMLLTLEKFNII